MKSIQRGTLGEGVTAKTGEETSTTLIARQEFELEEIVSRGAASPEGFWYDQERDEWVLLVTGAATLRFEDAGILEMKAGDHMMIPAGVWHRVEATSPDAVWLALHFRA